MRPNFQPGLIPIPPVVKVRLMMWMTVGHWWWPSDRQNSRFGASAKLLAIPKVTRRFKLHAKRSGTWEAQSKRLFLRVATIEAVLATKVTITRSDLDILASGDEAAQWLRQVSQPWMSFWEDRLHKQGFHPFDALAVGYVTMPDLFNCEISPARMGFSLFLEPFPLV